jgi:hypothetical protein
VDCAVNAAAAEQRLIGSIDNGVDVLLGDVALFDENPFGHVLLSKNCMGAYS